jgi:hypothetical protein
MSSSVLLRSKDLKKLFPEKIILRAWAAGWIKPAQKRPRFTLWPDETVASLKNRLLAGEYPPPLPSELKNRKASS